MRIQFQGPAESCDGTNSAVTGIFARPGGDRSRMANKPRSRAKIGRGTGTAEHPGTKRKLLEQLDTSFLFDKTTFHSAPRKALAVISQKTRMDLTTGARFWQEWAKLLLRSSRSDQKSKIEDSK